MKADLTSLLCNVRPDLCFVTRNVMMTFQVVQFLTFCKISNPPIELQNKPLHDMSGPQDSDPSGPVILSDPKLGPLGYLCQGPPAIS